MAFSDDLLDDTAPIWDAQKEHPFVRELPTAASIPMRSVAGSSRTIAISSITLACSRWRASERATRRR